MKLTVATWNTDHWKRTVPQRKAAWQLLRSSGYDVALLQEAVPPPDAPPGSVVWHEIGDWRRFGSAVVSLSGWSIKEITTARSHYEPTRSIPLLRTFPGSVALARIDPPEVPPIVFVSVYSVIDVYSTTTLFRQVADLIPLFDCSDGDRIILGGDLNISTQHTGDEAARYRAGYAAVESLGLVDLLSVAETVPSFIGDSCPCGNGKDCKHLPTHLPAAGGPGAHLDYLFAMPKLARECKVLRLDNAESTWDCSDHCPVVAEFDLQPTVEPEHWGDQFVDDVETTVRALLSEERAWGVWAPGQGNPKLAVNRSRTWILLYWLGSLVDGRPAQLELGVWRDPKRTGHAQVAHAGLVGERVTQRVEGLQVKAAGQLLPSCSIVEQPSADYVVVAFEPGNVAPERELRTALDGLIAVARVA